MKTIYLAGGCFWGVQKFIDQFEGIISTEVGYANGEKPNPTYEEVCNDSGHVETVKVNYDEQVINTQELIGYYFMVIDPLSINRQGGDSGIQYRTGIYYVDESITADIDKAVEKEAAKFDSPLAVEIMKLNNFYPAEEYHQKYLDKNPTGYCHINPAMMNLKKR